MLSTIPKSSSPPRSRWFSFVTFETTIETILNSVTKSAAAHGQWVEDNGLVRGYLHFNSAKPIPQFHHWIPNCLFAFSNPAIILSQLTRYASTILSYGENCLINPQPMTVVPTPVAQTTVVVKTPRTRKRRCVDKHSGLPKQFIPKIPVNNNLAITFVPKTVDTDYSAPYQPHYEDESSDDDHFDPNYPDQGIPPYELPCGTPVPGHWFKEFQGTITSFDDYRFSLTGNQRVRFMNYFRRYLHSLPKAEPDISHQLSVE